MTVAQIIMYLVKSDKTFVPPPGKMYRKVDSTPTSPENFELPFEGKLSQDNRWVIMANLIPWDEFEEEYARNFAEDIGAPALPFRIALGGLIIKEKLGTSDRETVEQIKENPYLQSFIGRNNYSMIEFIEPERIEPSVKRGGLESVDPPWEDRQPMSANKRRSKP